LRRGIIRIALAYRKRYVSVAPSADRFDEKSITQKGLQFVAIKAVNGVWKINWLAQERGYAKSFD
jgi:hypothetical protein